MRSAPCLAASGQPLTAAARHNQTVGVGENAWLSELLLPQRQVDGRPEVVAKAAAVLLANLIM